MNQVLLVANQLLALLSERTKRSISPCFLTLTNALLQIRDPNTPNTPCIFEVYVGESDDVFKIDNPSEKEIYFLAIDQCVFGNDSSKRCDCIVFDEDYLCFVELKLSVTSLRRGTERSKEAREQLAHTITYFTREFGHLIANYKFEAYVVMRSKVYPRSPNRNVREEFRIKYGVLLFEENRKEF